MVLYQLKYIWSDQVLGCEKCVNESDGYLKELLEDILGEILWLKTV